MAARSTTARPPIRWDRLGRCALLGVLALVVYLYIGPMANWVGTWQESKQRKADVAELQRENTQLREQRARLRKASALEEEARRLGMVRTGEKAYVVSGLPAD